MRGFSLPDVNCPQSIHTGKPIYQGGRHNIYHNMFVFSPIKLTKPLGHFFLRLKALEILNPKYTLPSEKSPLACPKKPFS